MRPAAVDGHPHRRCESVRDFCADRAQGPRPAGIIDFHHHASPRCFINVLIKYKVGERPKLDWTPARSIEDMDRAGSPLERILRLPPPICGTASARADNILSEKNTY
jgi:hypothetical protein